MIAIAMAYLVINFGGNFNNSAVSIPMESMDKCYSQIESINKDRKKIRGIYTMLCVEGAAKK